MDEDLAMLDMIKQLIPSPSVQTSSPVQTGSDNAGAFDRVFGQVGGATSTPARADRPDEDDLPLELGSGWETADQDATPAAAAGAGGQTPTDARSAEGGGGQAADGAADASRASAGGTSGAEGDAGGAPGQQGRDAGATTQSLNLDALQTLNGQLSAELAGASASTAGDAVAPEVGSGTPGTLSTDAPNPAVLSDSPDLAASEAGLEIQLSGELVEGDQGRGGSSEQVTVATQTAMDAQPELATQMQMGQAAEATSLRRRQDRAVSADASAGLNQSEQPIATVPITDLLAMPGEQVSGQGQAAVPGVEAISPAAVEDSTAAAAAAADALGADASELDVNDLASKTVRWQRLGMLDSQGAARIRLTPSGLGSVRVVLQTINDVVRVQLTVDSDSTRQLLQSNSERLAESLQANGLRPERVEVVVDNPAEQNTDQNDQRGGGQYRDARDEQSQSEPNAGQAFSEELEDELNLTA